MKSRVLFAFLLLSCINYAQSIIDTEHNDLRVSSLPEYNFGKGLGITAPDSLFQLNLRFRMQNRAAYFFYDEDDNQMEAEIRRLRLRFDGFVGDPVFSMLSSFPLQLMI